MKELKIHVERIVRPVRAVESRKLRMRRELLAHLQSAVDEGRSSGADESTAIKQAIERLGNPIELTKQLQATVPWLDRLLLYKIPVSHPVERWEVQAARKLYGTGPMRLLHISILCVPAAMLSFPSYMVEAVRNGLTHSGIPPAHPGLFFLSILIVWLAIYQRSIRFVFAAADPRKQPDLLLTLKRALVLVGLQIVFTLVATVTASNRLPTLVEFIDNIAVTVMLLIFSILVARRVASMRRPYDEWLTLDLAM